MSIAKEEARKIKTGRQTNCVRTNIIINMMEKKKPHLDSNYYSVSKSKRLNVDINTSFWHLLPIL